MTKYKFKTIELDMVGKTLEEVRNHLLKEYPKDGWDLAGGVHRDWLYDNPKEAPDELKDDSPWFYFMKDKVRHTGGGWHVPNVRWHGSEFERRAYWLVHGWSPSCRVVLLETDGALPVEPSNLPFDPLRLKFEYQGRKFKVVEE